MTPGTPWSCPNEQMVATAQDLIQQVLRGETPTVNP